MDKETINQVRREQTEHDLELLRAGLDNWLKHRRERDRDENDTYIGRHQTQLQAIGSMLTEAAVALAESIATLPLTSDVGDFYAACRQHDRAIVWLRRIWTYFEEKFSQRDGQTHLATVLRAADEIVWSCFRPIFVRVPGLPKTAPPLVYVESEYTPAAVESYSGGRSLRRDADLEAIRPYLDALPIPILRLPPWVVDAPWWLIYVGHEVGHHVQTILGLTAYFRGGIRAAAEAAGLSTRAVDDWSRWSEEIFADYFSVLMMGPWAIWSIVEAEWSDSATMVAAKTTYPAPVIRLALMVEAGRQLKVDVDHALRGLDLEALIASNPRTRSDYRFVEHVITFARQPLPQLGRTLDYLCDYDQDSFRPKTGKVARWAKHVRGKTIMPHERRLETGRMIASGALCAWAAVAQLTSASERSRECAVLRRNICTALLENAPRGTRTAAVPPGDVSGLGLRLANDLLDLSGPTHIIASQGDIDNAVEN